MFGVNDISLFTTGHDYQTKVVIVNRCITDVYLVDTVDNIIASSVKSSHIYISK